VNLTNNKVGRDNFEKGSRHRVHSAGYHKRHYLKNKDKILKYSQDCYTIKKLVEFQNSQLDSKTFLKKLSSRTWKGKPTKTYQLLLPHFEKKDIENNQINNQENLDLNWCKKKYSHNGRSAYIKCKEDVLLVERKDRMCFSPPPPLLFSERETDQHSQLGDLSFNFVNEIKVESSDPLYYCCPPFKFKYSWRSWGINLTYLSEKAYSCLRRTFLREDAERRRIKSIDRHDKVELFKEFIFNVFAIKPSRGKVPVGNWTAELHVKSREWLKEKYGSIGVEGGFKSGHYYVYVPDWDFFGESTEEWRSDYLLNRFEWTVANQVMFIKTVSGNRRSFIGTCCPMPYMTFYHTDKYKKKQRGVGSLRTKGHFSVIEGEGYSYSEGKKSRKLFSKFDCQKDGLSCQEQFQKWIKETMDIEAIAKGESKNRTKRKGKKHISIDEVQEVKGQLLEKPYKIKNKAREGSYVPYKALIRDQRTGLMLYFIVNAYYNSQKSVINSLINDFVHKKKTVYSFELKKGKYQYFFNRFLGKYG
jgi:hypothetical protein